MTDGCHGMTGVCHGMTDSTAETSLEHLPPGKESFREGSSNQGGQEMDVGAGRAEAPFYLCGC